MAELNVYRTGGLDLIDLAEDSFAVSVRKRIASLASPDGSVSYMEFNARPGRLFNDKRLRETVRIANNRRELVNRIVIEAPGLKGVRRAGFGTDPGFRFAAWSDLPWADARARRAPIRARVLRQSADADSDVKVRYVLLAPGVESGSGRQAVHAFAHAVLLADG